MSASIEQLLRGGFKKGAFKRGPLRGALKGALKGPSKTFKTLKKGHANVMVVIGILVVVLSLAQVLPLEGLQIDQQRLW